MRNDLADIPYGYNFLASNYYVKGKMFWKIIINPTKCKDKHIEWAAWRVLNGLNNFEIRPGQQVAVRGESREIDEP